MFVHYSFRKHKILCTVTYCYKKGCWGVALLYRLVGELCDILEEKCIYLWFVQMLRWFRSFVNNPKTQLAYTQILPRLFLLCFPLMSSTCWEAVVAAAWTDTVSIPGPAASLWAWVWSWLLLVLNVVYNNRIEWCLRLRFRIFIVSHLTRKACPYLSLDNQSTQPGRLCEYECFSARFTNLTMPCPQIKSVL